MDLAVVSIIARGGVFIMADSTKSRRHKRTQCPRCGVPLRSRRDDEEDERSPLKCPECGLEFSSRHHNKGLWDRFLGLLLHPPGETVSESTSRRREKKKWWNVVSSRYPCGAIALGLGGISLPLAFLSGMATFPAVTAVAFGIMGLLQRKSISRTQGGVGVGLGVIGLALALTVAPEAPLASDVPKGQSDLEQVQPVIAPSGSTDLQSADNPIF